MQDLFHKDVFLIQCQFELAHLLQMDLFVCMTSLLPITLQYTRITMEQYKCAPFVLAELQIAEAASLGPYVYRLTGTN